MPCSTNLFQTFIIAYTNQQKKASARVNYFFLKKIFKGCISSWESVVNIE